MERHITMNPTPGFRGDYYELEGEQYIQVEVSPESASVSWSAETSLEDTLQIFNDVLGSPLPEYDGSLWRADTDGFDAPSNIITEVAAQDFDVVRQLVANYDKGIVSWRNPKIKMKDGHIPTTEITYGADQLDWSTVETLVNRTAAPHVQEQFGEYRERLLGTLGAMAINY